MKLWIAFTLFYYKLSYWSIDYGAIASISSGESDNYWQYFEIFLVAPQILWMQYSSGKVLYTYL